MANSAHEGFCDSSVITIYVKHGKDSLPVSLPSSASIGDLMEQLQQLTNVLPRGQKLIFKGKVLDAKLSLETANLSSGSKVMLMASQGIRQGSDAVVKKNKFPARGVAAITRQSSKPLEMTRIDTWRATRIISLRDAELEMVPSEVWSLGSLARILDIGGNYLQRLPTELTLLTNLQKLRMVSNSFTDSQFEWQVLANLKQLTTLALDHNLLTCVPFEVGFLSPLKQFSVGYNKLVSVAKEIGNLLLLEKLDLSHNCLTEVPASLGSCSSLIQVDLSANLLKDLPETLGGLHKLKVLILGSNALKAFPNEILQGCIELSTLSLHGNELTLEDLEKMDGWLQFDERRKSKYSKQIEFNVMGSSSGFDEGADPLQWHHW